MLPDSMFHSLQSPMERSSLGLNCLIRADGASQVAQGRLCAWTIPRIIWRDTGEILVDRARRQNRQKRGSGEAPIALGSELEQIPATGPKLEVLAMHEVLDRLEPSTGGRRRW